MLISDEPYSKLAYDGVEVPPVLQIFPHSILTTSYSKNLSLAGERIGYAAVNPLNSDPNELFNALTLANRILGFVNAPASMQRAIVGTHDEVVGLEEYLERRDLLYGALTDMGYSVVKPQGAFYLFPQSPIPDDVAFCRAAQEHLLLLVPGSGFSGPGHFRLSYSSIELDQIQRSLPVFESLIQEVG
jgi:aspartate aminotransferase